MPASRAISPGWGVSTTVRPSFVRSVSKSICCDTIFRASASMTAGSVVAESSPVTNLAVSAPCPRPGPMASTVMPFVKAARCCRARLSGVACPSVFASSGHVISSGAKLDTNASAGAGTAAVTSPAPARSAARELITGAPALPPAEPNDPPTTSTWPNLPLLASAARGAWISACDDPAHSRPSVETMASSGEPMGATTTG